MALDVDPKAIVGKWAKRFGFGHYRIKVRVIPKAKAKRFFGTIHIDHEEEYMVIDLPPSGYLPKRVLEHLVIHELTHGLIGLASLGDSAEETVCNRLAKAFLGQSARGPREWNYRPNDDYAELEGDLRGYPRGMDLVDELPELERYVLSRLLWGHASLKEVAGEIDSSKRQVGRIRDRALNMLGKAVADEWAAHCD